MTPSEELIKARVATAGSHKVIASDLGLSEVELSRILHDHIPRVSRLLDLLGLEVVDKDHVQSLKAVLKAVL